MDPSGNQDVQASLKQAIKTIVREYQRNQGGWRERGILPWMVAARLDDAYTYSVMTLRRRMAAMAAEGELKRVGGPNARRGYII